MSDKETGGGSGSSEIKAFTNKLTKNRIRKIFQKRLVV